MKTKEELYKFYGVKEGIKYEVTAVSEEYSMEVLSQKVGAIFIVEDKRVKFIEDEIYYKMGVLSEYKYREYKPNVKDKLTAEESESLSAAIERAYCIIKQDIYHGGSSGRSRTMKVYVKTNFGIKLVGYPFLEEPSFLGMNYVVYPGAIDKLLDKIVLDKIDVIILNPEHTKYRFQGTNTWYDVTDIELNKGIYGAIWTKDGLKYAAKLNSNNKWDLLDYTINSVRRV